MNKNLYRLLDLLFTFAFIYFLGYFGDWQAQVIGFVAMLWNHVDGRIRAEW